MTDSLHRAATGWFEPVCQLLQVSSGDLGQQCLGELCLVPSAYHKVLVLEMSNILIPQILHRCWAETHKHKTLVLEISNKLIPPILHSFGQRLTNISRIGMINCTASPLPGLACDYLFQSIEFCCDMHAIISREKCGHNQLFSKAVLSNCNIMNQGLSRLVRLRALASKLSFKAGSICTECRVTYTTGSAMPMPRKDIYIGSQTGTTTVKVKKKHNAWPNEGHSIIVATTHC